PSTYLLASSSPRRPPRRAPLTLFTRMLVTPEAEAFPPKVFVLNIFCTRLQIALVYGMDQVRLGQIQFVVRAVDENTARIKQGAHRSIAQNRRFTEPGEEI